TGAAPRDSGNRVKENVRSSSCSVSPLNAQQQAIVLVSNQVQASVGALLHVADALAQFGEQALLMHFLAIGVELDAHQLAGAGDLSLLHRADEQIATPLGNFITGVEGQAAHGNT